MSAASRSISIFAKAKPGTSAKVLGDCPFSHAVLLVAGFKGVPFSLELVDLSNKTASPTFVSVAGADGSTPALLSKQGDAVEASLTSSSDIIDWLQATYPTPPMLPSTGPSADVGRGILGALKKAVSNTDPTQQATANEGLRSAVAAVDSALEKHPSRFLGGDSPGIRDAELAPQLRHALVAGAALRGIDFSGAAAARAYLEAWMELDAWKSAEYADDTIVEGWSRHLPK